MKIIKTANYNRIELALKLLEWHEGQGSPLYSVGSSWLAEKEVPNENIEWAVQELKAILVSIQREDALTSESKIIELKNLIAELEQELSLPEDEESDLAAYEAEMGRDTHKQHGDGYSVEDTSF